MAEQERAHAAGWAKHMKSTGVAVVSYLVGLLFGVSR